MGQRLAPDPAFAHPITRRVGSHTSTGETAGGRPEESRLTDLREHLEAVTGGLDRWLAELALQRPIPATVGQMKEALRAALGEPGDLTVRSLQVGTLPCLVAYIDGMVSDQLLHQLVIRPLVKTRPSDSVATAAWMERHLLPDSRWRAVTTVEGAVMGLLEGQALIHVEGLTRAWLADVLEFEHRGIDHPATEGTVTGPRDAFVEVLRVNTASLRRRMVSPFLRIEEMRVGRISRTRAAVAYVVGRADPGTVMEVRRRLASAPWDMVFSESQVAGVLQERRWSLFPQVRQTERPDVCAAGLAEGRVAVMLDGTPFAVMVPIQFWDLIQSPDDYYLRWPFAAILRLIRLSAVVLMSVGLALYVAVTTYNQELIPREFLFTLAASRESLPFPTALEAVVLSLIFDILREASTRLPRQIGGALTIVGGLVIGDTAVRAGIVTAPTLILIGISAMAAFTVPQFNTAIPFRILHYVFLLVATFLGMYGLALAVLIVVAHMASLRSLGVPYLSPLAPWRPQGLEDALVRGPWVSQRGKPPLVGHPGALGLSRRRPGSEGSPA